jgi:recombination protein RecT
MSSQGQSQEIALRQATQSAVTQLQDDEFAHQIQLAVPEGVSPRQFLRAAATAVLDNPKLAAANLRSSLLQATLKCAQDGLIPDGREAAFVIYGGREPKVQYQPMIGGLRRIAADHGWSLLTAVVYENDGFDPDLEEHRTNHKPTPLGQDRGRPIGAYAIAEHRDGRRVGPEVYTLEQIEKARQVSRAKDDGPWVTWWETMAEKTPGRRLFKKLPLDPKDARIASVLRALEDEPVDALYGPASGEAHDGQPEAPGAAPTASGGRPEHEPVEGEILGEATEDDEPLNEPSDEELDALGAGEVTAVDEYRFDRGKYEGKTFAEIFAEGTRGIGYLKWAIRDWQEGPFKEALREFAAQHPELGAGE